MNENGSTTAPEWNELDDRAVTYARALAMDAVQKVGNGHPGTAMSLAPVAYALFQRHMVHDPNDAKWLGRDRFVLSAGHTSLTLYTQLFYSGYGLELKDLEELRTWGSLTPGHPEHNHTIGVETTTGPLGQGIANAVGMAMAARYERGLLDPDAPSGESVFDHQIWVICSDGDMQEGISAEASSLAGTQALGNLNVIYDDNRISIEGDTHKAFTEDVSLRYRAYGWNVIEVAQCADGSVDRVAMEAAMATARAQNDRPTFIRMKSVIAWPAPHAHGTAKSHGSALGADEVAETKKVLGLNPDEKFAMPQEVLDHARLVKTRGAKLHAEWDEKFSAWEKANPERAELLKRLRSRKLPDGWQNVLPEFGPEKEIATRKASGDVIERIASVLPEFWGGSGDLAESNNTTIEGGGSFLPPTSDQPDATPYGRIIHFGIREHAMGAILNGIRLHGLTRVFGGTFLVFSDYMRPAVRLASLMQLAVTFVWTHDSIGLGEDGPTHQPVEHLAALRAIPGLCVVRPADANEVSQAWGLILEHDEPNALILSRQNLRVFDRKEFADASGVARGAYILKEASSVPKVILIATGSEVALAVDAQTTLESRGVATRVVSAPCLEWFDRQDQGYKDEILPKSGALRVSVEAGISQGWREYVGDSGLCISLEHYGASASGATLFEKFGFTPEHIVDQVMGVLA